MRQNLIFDPNGDDIPSAKHMLVETSDLDEAHHQVSKVFCRHRISFAGSDRQLSFQQSFLSLDRMAFSYVKYGADVRIDAGEERDWFMVHSTDYGQCAMNIGGQDVVADRDAITVSSPTANLRMRWLNNCGQLVLKIEREALETQLRKILNDDLRTPLEFLHDRSSKKAMANRRLLWFLAYEADCDENLLTSPLARQHVEDTLMTMILTGLPNSYSDRLNRPKVGAAPRHVKLAEQYIRENAHLPISVSDIAQSANVSLRTLFDGFKQFRETTPMAFLKSVRMDRIHNALLAGDSSVSVTSVAMSWGYTNLGRFAREYRSRFGELPSATLRRYKN